MFRTSRSSTSSSASSRSSQNPQRKGLPFRVLRTQAIPPLAYMTANSNVHTDDRCNYDWQYDSNAGHTIPVDSTRAPRYFVDSGRLDNQKLSMDYPIYARLPHDDFLYERPTDFFSSSEYDENTATTITPTSYSMVSDELSFSTPESPDPSSDQSDYSVPSTPQDLRSQHFMPPMPSSQGLTYSTIFRSHADVSYVPLPATMPEIGNVDSHRSGSDSHSHTPLSSDPRRPVYIPRPGTASPAALVAPGEPYAESVLSMESEDTVHRVARVNAQYNAAASALYGAMQRDASTIPSVQRVPTPGFPTTPTELDSHLLFTDGPLSDNSSRPAIYHDNNLLSRRTLNNNVNSPMPVYPPSSHNTRSYIRPSRHPDDFLPPYKEWDSSMVPQTPGNSPQSRQASPIRHHSQLSRSSHDRESDRSHSRPLPVPPSVSRRTSIRDGAPLKEANTVSYGREASNNGPKYEAVPQNGRSLRTGENEQPTGSYGRQSSGAARDSSNAWPGQAHSPTSAPQHASTTEPPRHTSKSQGLSKGRHRSADGNRSSDAARSSSPHGPRLVVKQENSPVSDRQKSTQQEPTTPARHSAADGGSTRPDRTSPDNDYNERRGDSRTEKRDRREKGYETSREERTTKSSRDKQDRGHQTSGRERSDRSTRSSVATQLPSEKPQEQGRRRRDSIVQPQAADTGRNTTSNASPDIILSPSLVPIIKHSASPAALSRSHSRGRPVSHSSQEPQNIYQKPIRRHSDDDRPLAGNNREGRDVPSSAPSRPPSAIPEPQRRFSDSDAPSVSPAFLASSVTHSRPLPQQVLVSGRAMTNCRTVRWNDNLICPSPSAPSQRRDGWFNRRGDQLWTNDGLYMPPPAGQEYPPDLDDYPEYGEGWMNEKGVRIDMGHRLVPKVLRPALKQTR